MHAQFVETDLFHVINYYILLHSPLPLRVSTSGAFLLAQVDIIPIMPDPHVVVISVVRMQLENYAGGIFLGRVAVQRLSLALPVQLLHALGRGDVEVEQHARDVGIVRAEEGPLEHLGRIIDPAIEVIEHAR